MYCLLSVGVVWNPLLRCWTIKNCREVVVGVVDFVIVLITLLTFTFLFLFVHIFLITKPPRSSNLVLISTILSLKLSLLDLLIVLVRCSFVCLWRNSANKRAFLHFFSQCIVHGLRVSFMAANQVNNFGAGAIDILISGAFR